MDQIKISGTPPDHPLLGKATIMYDKAAAANGNPMAGVVLKGTLVTHYLTSKPDTGAKPAFEIDMDSETHKLLYVVPLTDINPTVPAIALSSLIETLQQRRNSPMDSPAIAAKGRSDAEIVHKIYMEQRDGAGTIADILTDVLPSTMLGALKQYKPNDHSIETRR